MERRRVEMVFCTVGLSRSLIVVAEVRVALSVAVHWDWFGCEQWQCWTSCHNDVYTAFDLGEIFGLILRTAGFCAPRGCHATRDSRLSKHPVSFVIVPSDLDDDRGMLAIESGILAPYHPPPKTWLRRDAPLQIFRHTEHDLACPNQICLPTLPTASGLSFSHSSLKHEYTTSVSRMSKARFQTKVMA